MSAPVLGDPCWVGGCSSPSTYAVSNPAVRLMEALGTCSAHVGDLLGNAAKAALKGIPSVTLQVDWLRPCHTEVCACDESDVYDGHAECPVHPVEEPAQEPSVGYIVQDTTDGYVWGRDLRGEPFDREEAEAFAASRNSHLPTLKPYRVLALVEVS